MKDIKLKAYSQKFKFRVNAIVIHNNRILLTKLFDNKSFCLPGGHVKLGENTYDAIIREVMEELEIDCDINKEFALLENFYNDNFNFKVHELSIYYLIEPKNIEKISMKEFSRMDDYNGKLTKINFVWVELDDLKEIDVKPSIIKQKIIEKNFKFEHLVEYKTNEQ